MMVVHDPDMRDAPATKTKCRECRAPTATDNDTRCVVCDELLAHARTSGRVAWLEEQLKPTGSANGNRTRPRRRASILAEEEWRQAVVTKILCVGGANEAQRRL